MNLTNDEKEFIRHVVKQKKEHFDKEKGIAKEDATLAFIKAEAQYEIFLEKLLKKLS